METAVSYLYPRLLAPALGIAALLGCTGDRAFLVSNVPPAATIEAPDSGTEWIYGEPIEFQARVRDDYDVQLLQIEWISSIDGDLGYEDTPDPDGAIRFFTSALTPGEHVVTLRATDEGGERGEDTVQITIDGNQGPPGIQVINPVDGDIGIANYPYVFRAQANNLTNTPQDLVIEVAADPGGFVCDMQPDGNGRGSCSASLPIGNYLLTFTAYDDNGFSADELVTFQVLEEGDVDQDGDGLTPNGGDCNDSNPNVYPGADEVCDGLDNDCNPNTPIDAGTECYDDDGDGYCEDPPCTNATQTVPDCDDTQASVSPAGTEVCNNVDDNCNNMVDEGLGAQLYWMDGDGDGFGGGPPVSSCDGPPPGHVAQPGDCDDGNPNIHPNASEIASNGIDDNCNGMVDEGSPNFDNDGDGYCAAPPCVNAASLEADCDDTNPAIRPGATEVCGDGVDNNCDGVINEQNAQGCTSFYVDNDNDGYGATNNSACYCDPFFPYTAASGTDCDDGNALVHPGQTAWFDSPHAGGSFDYNCDNTSERRWTLGTSGCNVAGIGCSGGEGWLTPSPPTCGQSALFQEDCGMDYAALLIGCGASCFLDCLSFNAACAQCILSACPQSQVCSADLESRAQQCR